MKIDDEVMSKPDLRAIVDFRISFIVQNTSKTTNKCHYNDGWGPSSSDPKGQEGNQDCLMSRYNLCAKHVSNDDEWYDFTRCIYLNQAPADNVTDGEKGFNLTAQYCAAVTGHDFLQLKECAESGLGLQLLEKSHLVDEALNTNVDSSGHHHPDWCIIDGKNYGSNTSADWNWTAIVCQAYKGATKPQSCGGPSALQIV